MTDFKVEVPISVSSDKSSRDFGQGIADQIKKSLKSIGIGKGGGTAVGGAGKSMGKMTGILAAILAVLNSIDFIIKPVMSLLKAILTLLFLPLIPILKPVLTILKTFLESMKKARGSAPQIGKTDTVLDLPIAIINWAILIGVAIGDFIAELMKGAWKIGQDLADWLFNNVLDPMSNFISDIILKVGDIMNNSISWLIEKIKIALQWIVELGSTIWQWIMDGIQPLLNLGKDIWNFFLNALSSISNLGSKIWGFIKDALGSFASLVSRWFRKKKDEDDDEEKAVGGPVFKGNQYLVGENGPELFTPGASGKITSNSLLSGANRGNITINVNNPVVRNDSDIKKLANEVSRVLQRQMSGRFASG